LDSPEERYEQMQVIERFPRQTGQIPRARSFVRETLRSWGVDRGADEIVLLASELFTNSVIHGAGEVELRLKLLPRRIRVEVWDGGVASLPLVPLPDVPGRLSGRGLGIVDRLAVEWGSGGTTQRTRVWAELPRP
jgi:anti-sigma regulatory factor (Ser/Thr protein kinase)